MRQGHGWYKSPIRFRALPKSGINENCENTIANLSRTTIWAKYIVLLNLLLLVWTAYAERLTECQKSVCAFSGRLTAYTTRVALFSDVFRGVLICMNLVKRRTYFIRNAMRIILYDINISRLRRKVLRNGNVYTEKFWSAVIPNFETNLAGCIFLRRRLWWVYEFPTRYTVEEHIGPLRKLGSESFGRNERSMDFPRYVTLFAHRV